MDPEHLAALRQAATALIATAAAPTVLAALRTLLADPAFAAAAPALPLPAQSAPRPARDKPTADAAAAVASDREWDALRGSVRQAMTAQGLDFAGLGLAIGRSGTAVRIDLTSRKPPRRPVQAKLQEWLANGAAGAPEVAATGTTFPGNGNGIGTAD